jgi:3-oxoacyl-[acyl-carrier protein] reductase
MMELHRQRTIIVTGGNSGMGRAIAKAFANREEHVAIIGRNVESLRRVATELGPNAMWLQADVSSRNEVAEAVSAVVGAFGNIDVLVNAAGFVLGATTDMPLDEAERMWDAVIDTNLKGSFLMAVAVGPHLTRPGGRIINISSIAAFTGGSRAGSMAYAAAKAGIHGLTYGLARELSPQGITVNAIAPGFVANTGFTGDWSEERVSGIIAETPVGRGGHVDDIAAAVLYLASPEASFVTGEVLSVNGGWIFGH